MELREWHIYPDSQEIVKLHSICGYYCIYKSPPQHDGGM